MIHQFKMEDLNIIVDVNSGAIHVVDDISSDYIACVDQGKSETEIKSFLKEKYKELDFEEIKEEVNQLIDSQSLFSKDIYKDVVKEFNKRETIFKAMCLSVAHDCNMACKYCFASEGEYHGEREMMSFETGKKAIDFLIAHSGTRRSLDVDFFGGEPLMNFKVVKQIVEYAKLVEKEHNKEFKFTITTNGVLLNDENIKFINENMYNVVLSCDGRPSVHDNMRPFPNAKGTYDFIMPKFKKLVEERIPKRGNKSYYIRGTFTRNNLDFAKDVISMADEGFKEISVEPVVSPLNMPYALQEEDIKGLLKEYEILAHEMVKRKEEGKEFRFFHFMIDLSGGPCITKRLTGCGAGFEYLAIAPNEEIYPCHQFIGMEDFNIGTLDAGITNNDLCMDFKACNVYSKEECRDCWAKFYCSGGCTANGHMYNGSIHNAYTMGCELMKKRIECAIFVQTKSMLSNGKSEAAL